MRDKNEKSPKQAAALNYNEEKDQAPRLSAKGEGNLAHKIIEKAREQNIPIQEDQDLVQALIALELGQEIPEELYQVVAEILAFIYELEENN